MRNNTPYIPVAQCQDRAVYRISSRNLAVGVFRKETGGFVGIRTKFGSRYLFEEYHWDNGAPFGTVCPREMLDDVLPADMETYEYAPGSVEAVTGRACEFDKTLDANGQGFDTDIKGDDMEAKRCKGWVFVDTREYVGKEGRPSSIHNDKLFAFLEQIEKRLGLSGDQRGRTKL